MTTAIGRSVLDLPVDGQRTILDCWLGHAERAAEAIGLVGLPVRVLLSRGSMAPRRTADRLSIERDLSDHTGDGGLLAKLAGEYDDEDLILVASADQVPLAELAETAAGLCAAGGWVNIATEPDEQNRAVTAGIMLMSCKALRLIPAGGVVDIGEQALPAIAAEHEVRLYQADKCVTLPVRTLDEYMIALRHIRADSDARFNTEPLAEDWQANFQIAETGAMVDGASHVRGSVILAGGRVEAGAVVVRSVVCGGATVGKDERVVDQVVRPVE
jgi:NDP-sugar pyrophosphorylase family protein